MTSPPRFLDASFIAEQRRRLLADRLDLSSGMIRGENEDAQIELAASEQANELEDRAQDLTIAENNRILGEFSAQRRISIDRALAKIADGTYGFADLTGEPIPLARLQAIPDAV